MASNKILMVGLGSLGGHVLEFLARTPGVNRIIAADVNEDWGVRKTNNAILGAVNQGFDPNIIFRKIDLNDVEGTVEIVRNEEPDLIFNATTFQSWWVIGLLQDEVYEKLLGAGFGPWLPMHLTLTHKLMMAVKKAGIKTHVVSSSFPDAVHPVLGKVDLAPVVGIGNFDLLIPRIKKIVSEKLSVPMRNISVFMVGHHVHDVLVEDFGTTGGAPYFLKILVGDKNVTEKLDPEKIFSEPLPTPLGNQSDQQVASSAVKNILAILNDTGELTHAPGPNGLPGGYPVRLSAKGAEVVLPEELSLEEAIKINEEAQKFDGIQEIKNDGTVVFTEKSVRIMREMLNYECEELRLGESEERAVELRTLYNNFAEIYS
ncbi:MAG: hypothetical protein JSV12_07370 [Candidatus Bathyarchaeota archaeon]|nr:MAG: hypothetical protein JSV12_07370 [Candidatus Bathyarchaeota archaeon]